MDQTWRVHYKYKNYAADSTGQVKNITTNSIIHPTFVRDNIYVLNLYEEGVKKKFQLHNFIYECWHGPIPEGYRVTFYNKNYGPIIHGPSGPNLKLTESGSILGGSSKSYYRKKLPLYLVDINGTETIYKSMKEVADNLGISTKKVKAIIENGGLYLSPPGLEPEREFKITPW
jgi:hypothetical protein